MMRTFATGLRATLTATGLLVAIGAQPGRAEQPPAPLPANPPVQAYPPPPAATTPAPAIVAVPAPVPVPEVGLGVPPQGHSVESVVTGTPGCGQQIYDGGPGYLMSGCWGPGCTSSMYYVRADFLRIKRDIDNPRDLFAFSQGGQIFSGGLPEFFDSTGALRVTVGLALVESSACDLFLEMTTFSNRTNEPSIDGFSGFGNFFGTPLGFLFDSTNAQFFNYESTFDSAEANLKWDYYVDNSLYLLLGLRFIRFDDDFKLDEFGRFTVAGPPPAVVVGRAFLDRQVTNNLFGGQIGFDWQTRDLASRWGLQAYGRAGLFANVLDGEYEGGGVSTLAGDFLESRDPGRLQASAMLEGGITGTFKLRPNVLLRAGYHVTWLGAIALAPEQDFNGKISNDQDVFHHGPFLGLEIHWGCCR